MNIFWLDKDIEKNVQMYSDQHVVKMILETAQLLCSVHHVLQPNTDIPYKLSHVNHPCAVWARTSEANYKYLCMLGMALAVEYTRRFYKTHKSTSVIDWARSNTPVFASEAFTQPPQVVSPTSQRKCLVEAYRAYYVEKYINSMHDKRRRMRFTLRNIPEFILEEMRRPRFPDDMINQEGFIEAYNEILDQHG